MRKLWENRKKRMASVLALVLVLMTAGGCGNDLEKLEEMIWNEEWDTYDVSSLTAFDENYPIVEKEDFYEDMVPCDGIVNLNLEMGGCEVKLESSPDSNYYVSAENISAFQVFSETGTLYLKAVQTGTWTGGSSTNMKVVLQIPEGIAFENIELSLGAGNFHINSLTAKNVQAQIGAGKFELSGLRAENLLLELGAGQALLEDAEVTEEANIKVGAGELVFSGSIPGNLNAECAMGNMEIRIFGSKEADHNLALSCVGGNLTVGGTVYSGMAEQEMDNNAHSDYDLECAMGNLTLVFE